MSAHPVKRWSVNAVSDGHTPLRFFVDGRPLTQSASATLDNVSPVEHFLVSIAGCFALSCRAVIARRKLARMSFEVVVTGDKAPPPFNRLGHIALVTVFCGGIPAEDAAAISDEAKSLCTVTNSLLSTPAIDYGSRAIKELPPVRHEFDRPAVSH